MENQLQAKYIYCIDTFRRSGLLVSQSILTFDISQICLRTSVRDCSSLRVQSLSS
jgi:hypothetical protein